jgi:hypothetical protein
VAAAIKLCLKGVYSYSSSTPEKPARSGQPPFQEAAQNWQFSIAKKPNGNRKKMSNSRLSEANSSEFGKESGSRIKIAQT